jgi:hypothetical protein
LKGGKIKMEKKKITIGIFALAAVALLSIGMVSAFGFGEGFMKHDLTEEEMAERDAQREEVRLAVEGEDYSAWKSLMEERLEEMKSGLTEENFNQMIERHQEMESARANGDFEGKRPLNGEGKGRMGMHQGECPMLSE